MKRKEIALLASKKDSEIRVCKVTEYTDKGITFIVDEGLSKPKSHLHQYCGKQVVIKVLNDKQITDPNVYDIVKCSFAKEKFATIGSDTLFKCMVQCFAEHRPLVISPDIIWILISQTLANHIFEHAEEYRDKIVDHEGKLELEIESGFDLKDKRTNWSKLLDGFYEKIAAKTKNDFANKIVSDFSTTSVNDRICSIATLMHGVEAYFSFSVCRIICGIPYITLQGTKKDWENLHKKASILKEFGLAYWYKWLSPILREFTRAASGKPHLDFWKSIVQVAHEEDFSTGRGCIPDIHDIDGWCVALFPYKKRNSGRMCYDKCINKQSMNSETIRVGFKYKEEYPNGSVITTPMELWCGIIGVDEDKKTYALIPKVGWFVRKSHEHEESLNRLKEMNSSNEGIRLKVEEVPEILNELENIDELSLTFKDKITVPEWMFEKPINKLSLFGNIDNEYFTFLKSKFHKVCINEDPWEVFYEEDHNEDEDNDEEEPLYGCVGGITKIGLYHNLPVNDMKTTARELSRLLCSDIRIYYRNRWKYDSKRHYVYRNYKERDIELLKIENDDFYNRINVEASCYNIDNIKSLMGDRSLESLTYDDDGTEYFFKQDYKENTSELYTVHIDWCHTIKIYPEIISLDITFEEGYYEWEKAFHGEGRLASKIVKYTDLVKERAQLFGCKEIAIFPDGYDPTREIKNRLHWKISDLKDYVKRREYLNDFNGECGGDLSKWRSNERHIHLQEYLNKRQQISEYDFISIVVDSVE